MHIDHPTIDYAVELPASRERADAREETAGRSSPLAAAPLAMASCWWLLLLAAVPPAARHQPPARPRCSAAAQHRALRGGRRAPAVAAPHTAPAT